MLGVALESVRAAILLAIMGYLWRVGRDRFDQTQNGWSLIVGGFGLLLIGSLLDISDNFEGLNFLVVVGDTEVEAILEKFVGFLGGFVVIAVGLMLWVSGAQRLNLEISERKQAEEALRRIGAFGLAVVAARAFSLGIAGQVLTFRTRAWLSFAPPTCRMPLGQHSGQPPN